MSKFGVVGSVIEMKGNDTEAHEPTNSLVQFSSRWYLCARVGDLNFCVRSTHTELTNVLPLNHGAAGSITMHVSPTARNFF